MSTHNCDGAPTGSVAEDPPARTEEASGGRADEIRLSLPAEAPYSRVVTLTAAAIATRHGFGHRTIARLADGAGEVFATAVATAAAREAAAAADGASGADPTSPETTVVFRVVPSAITVAVAMTTADGPDEVDFTVERDS